MVNMGKIGFSNYAINKKGYIFSLVVKRMLEGTVCLYGYRVFTLKDDNGKARKMKHHRLLAMMFIDGDHSLHINHKDGNKLNNNLDNLEWVTIAENNRHAIKEGLNSRYSEFNKHPEKHQIKHDYNEKGTAFLTEEDVHLVCQMAEDGYRLCDISGITGFDFYVLSNLLRGKHPTKVHILNQYDISKVKKTTRMSPESVIEICELLLQDLSMNTVAKITGKHPQSISNIRNGVTYKSISHKYEFSLLDK